MVVGGVWEPFAGFPLVNKRAAEIREALFAGLPPVDDYQRANVRAGMLGEGLVANVLEIMAEFVFHHFKVGFSYEAYEKVAGENPDAWFKINFHGTTRLVEVKNTKVEKLYPTHVENDILPRFRDLDPKHEHVWVLISPHGRATTGARTTLNENGVWHIPLPCKVVDGETYERAFGQLVFEIIRFLIRELNVELSDVGRWVMDRFRKIEGLSDYLDKVDLRTGDSKE